MVVTVEGSYCEEDNLLETLMSSTKINELSVILNSLQQEVTRLAKGKAVLTANTTMIDCCSGNASDSNFMHFTSTTNLNIVCCAS